MPLHLKTGDGDLALITEPSYWRDAHDYRMQISCSPSIYIVVINCGWRMDGKVGGAWDGDWGGDSSSDVTFLRKSQGLVKKHSYFIQAVCILLWIDCIETYMVVT